jgi:hypothetical protein
VLLLLQLLAQPAQLRTAHAIALRHQGLLVLLAEQLAADL